MRKFRWFSFGALAIGALMLIITLALLRIFYSENLWFDPEKFLQAKQVTVLLDPANSKSYYMDLSFLPHTEES